MSSKSIFLPPEQVGNSAALKIEGIDLKGSLFLKTGVKHGLRYLLM